MGNADNIAGTPDEALEAFISQQQFFVLVADDSDSTAEFGTNIGLWVISSSVAGMGTKYETLRQPVLVMNANVISGMGMTGSLATGVSANATVQIADPGHPLAGGLSGAVRVFEGVARSHYGGPRPAAAVVGTVDEPGRAAIFAYEAGAMMVRNPAPHRRTGFFSSEPNLLTPEGIKLLKAAFYWTWSGQVP